jgi:hypothetical protein
MKHNINFTWVAWQPQTQKIPLGTLYHIHDIHLINTVCMATRSTYPKINCRCSVTKCMKSHNLHQFTNKMWQPCQLEQNWGHIGCYDSLGSVPMWILQQQLLCNQLITWILLELSFTGTGSHETWLFLLAKGWNWFHDFHVEVFLITCRTCQHEIFSQPVTSCRNFYLQKQKDHGNLSDTKTIGGPLCPT